MNEDEGVIEGSQGQIKNSSKESDKSLNAFKKRWNTEERSSDPIKSFDSKRRS